MRQWNNYASVRVKTVRHFAAYNYQLVAEFRKMKEETVIRNPQLITATSALPIVWLMALAAAWALIVSLTEQLDQRSRTYAFLHGIVSLTRSSILFTNECYTRWSSEPLILGTILPVTNWMSSVIKATRYRLERTQPFTLMDETAGAWNRTE